MECRIHATRRGRTFQITLIDYRVASIVYSASRHGTIVAFDDRNFKGYDAIPCHLSFEPNVKILLVRTEWSGTRRVLRSRCVGRARNFSPKFDNFVRLYSRVRKIVRLRGWKILRVSGGAPDSRKTFHPRNLPVLYGWPSCAASNS